MHKLEPLNADDDSTVSTHSALTKPGTSLGIFSYGVVTAGNDEDEGDEDEVKESLSATKHSTVRGK